MTIYLEGCRNRIEISRAENDSCFVIPNEILSVLFSLQYVLRKKFLHLHHPISAVGFTSSSSEIFYDCNSVEEMTFSVNPVVQMSE